MGRLSRYKKVKSIDPFAKNNTWTSDVGDKSTVRRVKRKSKTAQRFKEQKLRQRRGKVGGSGGNGKVGAGSNGWGQHDDGGYDLPPVGGDEWDMADLMGSVKKEKVKSSSSLLDTMEPQHQLSSSMPTVFPSDSKQHQVQSQTMTTTKKPKGKQQQQAAAKKGDKQQKQKQQKQQNQTITTPDGELVITHKTPTKDIIAAHSNPKRNRSNNNNTTTDEGGLSKKERRKEYLQEKKLKKKRGASLNSTNYNSDDDDDNNDVLTNHRLQQQQFNDTQQHPSSTTSNKQPKKHVIQQQNYSHTMIARSVMLDDQVERPPTFSVLPRGAHKLPKNQKKNNTGGDSGDDGKSMEGGDVNKEQRIRKEQQALEAMREKVMRQYSIMREKRRSGGV